MTIDQQNIEVQRFCGDVGRELFESFRFTPAESYKAMEDDFKFIAEKHKLSISAFDVANEIAARRS